MRTKPDVMTFDQFLEDFQESDTFNRMLEEEADTSYHEEGSFGLSHRQMIEGWHDFLNSEVEGIDEGLRLEIATEIKECQKWHENNGSIDEVI